MPLEPRSVRFSGIALDLPESSPGQQVAAEIERGGERLEQHELGVERPGELRRLAERRQGTRCRVLDRDQDAADAAHGPHVTYGCDCR